MLPVRKRKIFTGTAPRNWQPCGGWIDDRSKVEA